MLVLAGPGGGNRTVVQPRHQPQAPRRGSWGGGPGEDDRGNIPRGRHKASTPRGSAPQRPGSNQRRPRREGRAQRPQGLAQRQHARGLGLLAPGQQSVPAHAPWQASNQPASGPSGAATLREEGCGAGPPRPQGRGTQQMPRQPCGWRRQAGHISGTAIPQGPASSHASPCAARARVGRPRRGCGKRRSSGQSLKLSEHSDHNGGPGAGSWRPGGAGCRLG